MNLSESCIRRPVMTTLITASLIVFGAFAYRLLGVAALPAVDFPTIEITATLPGASAETMAASVASPIERQLSTISGISSMTSSSSLGTTRITIQFDLNRTIDGAALDVQTALVGRARRLPVEMTTPPTFRKVNPGDFPVLFFSLNSQTLPLSAVNEYAEQVLAQQISQLPGVAQVLVYGAQRFAVRVQVDPVAAAQRNISLDDIRNVVAKANSNSPVGTLVGPRQNFTLTATGAMTKAEEYRKVVVAYRNGSPVKLEEIARVIDSVENDKVASWFNERRSVVLAIQRQTDANTVAVVDSVEGTLAGVPRAGAGGDQHGRAERPLDLDPRLGGRRAGDAGHRRRARHPRDLSVPALGVGHLIPSLAVPVSLIATCGAMYAFGFSINNMTLLALTLSVGFVVDDAIVMLENIVRHIEGGMRPFEAALKGAREIGFTIISITFSLIAVFIPVLLMGGMVGRIFREFAVTIAVAIVISGFVSLTLTPMLCARVLKGHHEHRKQNIVLRAFEAMFKGWLRAYEWTLDRVLRFKFVMLLITFATVIATVVLYVYHSERLFPHRGHRVHRRHHRGRRRHLVPGNGGTPDEGGGDRPQGSGSRVCQLHGRGRRAQSDHQLRPPVHRAQAARRTQGGRGAGDPAPAAHRQHGDRHAGVLPAGAEHQHHRPHHQERIPLHDAVQRHGDALPARPRNDQQARRARRSARCHERPLYSQPADDHRDRSRKGRRSTASRSIRSARNCSTRSERARWRRSSRPRTTTR